MIQSQRHTHTAAALAAAQIKNSFPTMPAIVSLAAACAFVGIARQTGDHWLRVGKFPVPTIRLGARKHGVPLIGLQIWLMEQLVAAGYPHGELEFVTPNPIAPGREGKPVTPGGPGGLVRPPHKRGRGRPRKIQQMEGGAA